MSWRKLEIEKEIWLYIIGNKGVKIRSPKDKVTWVKAHEILGLSEEQYLEAEREAYNDDYDEWVHIPIGPSNVKEYILKNLRNKK